MSKNTVDYEALLPNIPYEDAPIPKRIHQIFLGKPADQLPDAMKENVQYICRINPDWEYHLWSEEDIDSFILGHYNKEILSYFRMISPDYRAAQADFLRYLIVYSLGGVYLDIKSSMERPLDEILLPSDRNIIYHWNNDVEGCYKGFGYYPDLPRDRFPYGEFHQGFVISSPGHPILRAVILDVLKCLDNYNPFTTGVGLWGVLRTTGPIAYSFAIERVTKDMPKELYRHIRCAEEIGLRISIYDSDGAFAHRKKIANYHNQLSAISRNGSEFYTKYFHFFFWSRWVLRILCDKIRQRFQ